MERLSSGIEDVIDLSDMAAAMSESDYFPFLRDGGKAKMLEPAPLQQVAGEIIKMQCMTTMARGPCRRDVTAAVFLPLRLLPDGLRLCILRLDGIVDDDVVATTPGQRAADRGGE
jgi:hypothetical protein